MSPLKCYRCWGPGRNVKINGKLVHTSKAYDGNNRVSPPPHQTKEKDEKGNRTELRKIAHAYLSD